MSWFFQGSCPQAGVALAPEVLPSERLGGQDAASDDSDSRPIQPRNFGPRKRGGEADGAIVKRRKVEKELAWDEFWKQVSLCKIFGGAVATLTVVTLSRSDVSILIAGSEKVLRIELLICLGFL